jgi:hypothetical protein
MAILNNDSLLKNGYKFIRDWNDYNYWYLAVSHNSKLIVPSEIISSDIIITVCTEFEGYHQIVEQIYKELVIDLNIPPNRILLISENADLHDHILTTAKQYNTTPIKYEWSLVSQYAVGSQSIKNFSILKNIRPKTNISNKYFLNFNRRWRIHRPAMVALMYSLGLLNKGHVSLGPIDGINDTWPVAIKLVTKLLEKDEILIKLIKDHIEEITNLKPLYLDTTELNINLASLYPADIIPHNTINLYKDTTFSLVSETHYFDFENNGRFITEKTFKPMAYHHPFILISKPFSLKLLQDLGYKTFSPFIDESYDEEIDDVKRLHLILKEVARLCNMNSEDLTIFLKNVDPITDHNFNRLINNVSNIHKIL